MLENILNQIKQLGWHWSLDDEGLIEIETKISNIPIQYQFKSIEVKENPLEAAKQALNYINNI
jgi:hypothetical protein